MGNTSKKMDFCTPTHRTNQNDMVMWHNVAVDGVVIYHTNEQADVLKRQNPLRQIGIEISWTTITFSKSLNGSNGGSIPP